MTSSPQDRGLTVAVTGPTGTFGFGLVPLLQADDRVERIVGIARRPFDPQEHGWSKMVYRQGDVRDPEALEQAFEGADVVVHLAFLIVSGAPETTQAVNVEGTVNAFRAAAAAGADRFVYASSIAAYGFHPDTPVPITEEQPPRRADTLFYAQEKAELEERLAEESAAHPELGLYLLRPPVVLGPHAVGAKVLLPAPLAGLAKLLASGWKRLPVPVPLPVADVPVQFVHEADVGSAIVQCVVAGGPPGAYNIAADDVLSSLDVAREVGVQPLPLPGAPLHAAARAVSRLPGLPPAGQWSEALAQPMVMDCTKAKTELGWAPQHSSIEALRSTLG